MIVFIDGLWTDGLTPAEVAGRILNVVGTPTD